MKNLSLIFAVLIIGTVIVSCKKAPLNCSHDRTVGFVKDYTGLDGCEWVIETTNKGKLEVISAPTGFLVDGKAVDFCYEIIEGASICMVGKQVIIHDYVKGN